MTLADAASGDMRRDFDSRDDLIAYLHEQFPDAAAAEDQVAPTQGGRAAALAVLAQIDPPGYAATRNHLDGAVTRLSPYIRYGVVSLAEVRRVVLAKVRRADAEKLVNELATRDYFQRVYQKLGDGIWQDREAYKTGYDAAHYDDLLPDDIRDGTTGMVCIDSFADDLRTTGYLHNHARLWLAGYLVHWRAVKWQAGARWFLQHLLDGDPGSNNMSWQWVASTFSSKPYFFNRENLERFSGAAYCTRCPLYGRCDFEGTYEALDARLFPNKPIDAGEDDRGARRR